MREKFDQILARYQEIEGLLADPAVIQNQDQYQKLAKEYSDLGVQVEMIREILSLDGQVSETEHLLSEKPDEEMEEMARQELTQLTKKRDSLLEDYRNRLIRKETDRNRNLIVEVRAGTGGQEASLFAADLARMYAKYCEQKSWKLESISSHPSETGGFKEVIFSISGDGAERHLKFESGGHRVQRVPVTEASGRIHTSAATVAVLFEPEEVEVEIDPSELKIDVFRSSGPGGQSVNTTDSAIRITHLPTGMVVICQDERSQLKNKYKAMRVLRARLKDKIESDNMEKETRERKILVGSGDRSEKIRTYNFPDRRVTDHRIGFTSYRLQAILDGDMEELTEALIKAEEEQILNERT